jgi:hypothetical protein
MLSLVVAQVQSRLDGRIVTQTIDYQGYQRFSEKLSDKPHKIILFFYRSYLTIGKMASI